MAKIISFSEVSEKLKNPSTIVLDVREPPELTSDGKISGTKNIPVGEVVNAFKMSDSEFHNTYGFPKPQKSADIVIHCKAGVRAANAAKVLIDSGYSDVQVYPGILDWIENGGKVEK